MGRETALGQVTVSTGTFNGQPQAAAGSGVKDGNDITVQLGPQVWIQRGGNYTLTAGGHRWHAMCKDGPDNAGYYNFSVTT